MRAHRGFTLVEILVVVAIVALLAATAVVQVQRARMVANDQMALSNLREVAKACHFYCSINNVFPNTLTLLGTPASNPPYLDAQLIGNGTTATKQGYTFTYTVTNGGANFTVVANPVQHGVTGDRHFYVARDLIYHATTENRDATPNDPAIP